MSNTTNVAAPLQHLAIIMDGNGRWAEERGLPRVAGHQQGVRTVVEIVNECVRQQISCLTLFAFSSENWGRPESEVETLMSLLLEFLASQRQRMLDDGVRLRVIGDRARLSATVRSALNVAEEETRDGGCLTLVLALSYGGRDEIVRAARQIARRVASGEIAAEDVDAADMASALDTAGLPDPDLLIRTSGELRISNFLLWQLAYAELYFVDAFWPDFGPVELRQALDDYRQRRRRFGLTAEQTAAGEGLSNSAS
ncbi:MAG: isoprenyl transferase [Geopsychrobacter sp.]|nr:isoprenyl transferase [Geopsychrobacter sp.]